ncbi:MAG: ammonia-forming cytochrome c nitrite reductase subunit c552 [Oscillospiraceae bacterium]|nr:ammonia-forming cytochrome c nitrite reductase subunit c552 [Oscillospiraceae bacterium]
MKKHSKRPLKLIDLIGAGCGIFLLVVLIVSIVIASLPVTAGVRDSQVPEDAFTLTGTAPGRNGDITVDVVMTEDEIYQIKVTDHSETANIGELAVRDLPVEIYKEQSLNVDAITGATITSDAIKEAIICALESGGIKPAKFGGARIVVREVAEQVQLASGVSVTFASEWAEKYPNQYETWALNSDNSVATDYLEDYPMLVTLYEPYGFSKDYMSARGHSLNLEDLLATKRIGPNSMASCWTCKAPEFNNMVNEQGESVYSLPFADLIDKISEPISCYNCHANTPGQLTVTHTYLTDAVGEDFENIDAASLSCGQCHVEYYFYPGTSATTLPYTNLATMTPDDMLAYYNNGANFPSGEPFVDYTNPRTGVKQIKVQHPELETYLGAGSQHRNTYTCADCHMGTEVSASGETFSNHYLASPLDNAQLIANECSECHTDLVSEVRELQADVERRTYAIGYELEFLTEKLAEAVAGGEYTEQELDAIRALARDAQFYWDFVFVENSEGAHNSELTYMCLNKAEALTNQALGMFKR